MNITNIIKSLSVWKDKSVIPGQDRGKKRVLAWQIGLGKS